MNKIIISILNRIVRRFVPAGRSKQWHHPTRNNFDRICDVLHQRCAVPTLHHQAVHVLTNDAVFKGLVAISRSL